MSWAVSIYDSVKWDKRQRKTPKGKNEVVVAKKGFSDFGCVWDAGTWDSGTKDVNY